MYAFNWINHDALSTQTDQWVMTYKHGNGHGDRESEIVLKQCI